MKQNVISEVPFKIWIVLIITLGFIIAGFNDLVFIINGVLNASPILGETMIEGLYRLLIPIINILLLSIFGLKIYNRKKNTFLWLEIFIVFQFLLLFKNNSEFFATFNISQDMLWFLQLISTIFPYLLYWIVSHILAAPYVRSGMVLASSTSSLEGTIPESGFSFVKPVRGIYRTTFYRRLFLVDIVGLILSFYFLKGSIKGDDPFGMQTMVAAIMLIIIVILIIIINIIFSLVYEYKTKKKILSLGLIPESKIPLIIFWLVILIAIGYSLYFFGLS